MYKIIISIVFVSIMACKNDSKTSSTETQAQPQNQQTNAPAQQAPNVTVPANMTPVSGPGALEPAQNAKGVWHFTCPKACPGGAGQSIECPKCGTKMTHNQLYHQQ